MRIEPVLLTLMLVTISEAAFARHEDTPPPVKAAGKPEACISTAQIKESRVYGDSTIDFYTNGGKVYRNSLPAVCPQLGFEEKFSYTTGVPQLCSTDLITVLVGTGSARGATCGLGAFQAVEGAPK